MDGSMMILGAPQANISIYIYNIYITYNKYIYSIYTDIQILELTKENAGIMWIDKRSTGDI